MKTVKNNKYTTTFKTYEENGIGYHYDPWELRKAFEEVRTKKGLTAESLRWLISDETGIPAETVLNHLRVGEWRRNPASIKAVKKYGKYLLGDEYAFLKRIPTPDELYEKSSEELHSDPVKAVFGMLYDILALYESSDCYNYIPNTDNMDGAWDFFEGRIGNVRKKLTADFLGKRDSAEYQKLEQIIDETEVFIKSYSRPGVVERWRKINPQINYFDCVFDLIDELGMEIAQLLNCEGRFAFFPSVYVIRARDMYFAEKAVQNVDGNLQYTETRFFQNELLQTLAMVFENDFGGKDNSWDT